MRKRTQNYFFNNLLWYLIYLLPLLCFIIILFTSGDIVSLSTCMSEIGLDVLLSSDITNSLIGIFGGSGSIPLFANNDIIIYCSYFVSVYLLHLLVDFLLFIPRLTHDWLNKFYGGD